MVRGAALREIATFYCSVLSQSGRRGLVHNDRMRSVHFLVLYNVADILSCIV
jgi:hypothetical protein